MHLGRKSVQKYFERYAANEHRLADLVTATYAHVLVVPCFAEGAGIRALLESVAECDTARQPVLVVAVLNARADAPAAAHHSNELTRRTFHELYGPALRSATWKAQLYQAHFGHLLCIDRAKPGAFFDDGQGVGHARRIGSDLAARLILAGAIHTPWVHTTDADAQLPRDYFIRAQSWVGCAGALAYPYRHLAPDGASPAQVQAMQYYDAGLRYYVHGLRHANSPYAYHTIGSTIAVDANTYVVVRGFPERVAGEDFYLLNKVAKVAPIGCVGGAPILLSGRLSDRVPFGTGVAISDPKRHCARTTEAYDPRVFDCLGAWIAAIRLAASHRLPWAELLGNALADHGIDPNVARTTENADMQAAVDRAHDHVRAPQARLRCLHAWFDALATLKLIHQLRVRMWPSLPLEEAVRRSRFMRTPPPESFASTYMTPLLQALEQADAAPYTPPHFDPKARIKG